VEYTITGERDELAGALDKASKRVASGGGNPALTQVRVFRDGEGTPHVEASDGRMAVRVMLSGVISAENPDTLFHPKIAAAVASMQPGEVEIAVSDGTATVTGKGKAKYTVPLGSGEWRPLKVGAEEVDWSDAPEFPADDVGSELNRAMRFAARDEQNPVMKGVNLRVEENSLVVESTDTYRLFQKRGASTGPLGIEDATVPSGMVSEISRLFSGGPVKLAADSNVFYAADPSRGIYFSCRRVGGKYPDLDQFFPKEDQVEWRATVARAEIADVLARLKRMAGEKPAVRISLEEVGSGAWALGLSITGDEGSAEEWVAVNGSDHKPLVIGVNVSQMSDVLGEFKGDEVTLTMTHPLRPITLEEGDVRALVMPVKLP
jgi:DNA polymerase III sliding clamp (beta) subunit (PCNA family)